MEQTDFCSVKRFIFFFLFSSRDLEGDRWCKYINNTLKLSRPLVIFSAFWDDPGVHILALALACVESTILLNCSLSLNWLKLYENY